MERTIGGAMWVGCSSRLGRESAAGGPSNPKPRQWNDSSDARRFILGRSGERSGILGAASFARMPSDSGATSNDEPKMVCSDLRALSRRADRGVDCGKPAKEDLSEALETDQVVEVESLRS